MTPIRALFLQALLVGPLLLFPSLVASRHDCYLPNGQPASGPAGVCKLTDSDTPLSQCCHNGDLCLSNQLCGSQDPRGEFSYYRGTCTEKVWRNTDGGAGCVNPCPISYGNEETVPMHWCVEEDGTMSWYCGNDAPPGDKGCTRVGADMDLPEVLATAGSTPTAAAFGDPTDTADGSKTTTESHRDIGATDTVEPTSRTVQLSLGQPTGTDTARTEGPKSSTPPSIELPPMPPTSTDSSSSSTPPLFVSSPDGPSAEPSTQAVPVSTTLIETTPPPEGPSSTPGEIKPTITSSQLPPSTSSANPGDSPPNKDEEEDGSFAIPIGVGVAVGASILIAGSALVYFYQRKRRREAPVRAETPPPFEFSFLNSQAPDWLGPAYAVPPPPGPVHRMGSGKMPKAGQGAGFGPGVPASSSSMVMENGMQQHHGENARIGPMEPAAEMRGTSCREG